MQSLIGQVDQNRLRLRIGMQGVYFEFTISSALSSPPKRTRDTIGWVKDGQSTALSELYPLAID